MSSLLHRFIHACQRRTVTGKSVLGGIAAGTGAGALTTTLWFVVTESALAVPAIVISPFVWWFGLFFIAGPAWLALHALKARCWSAAMTLGAILTPMPVFTAGGAAIDWPTAGLMALQGAFVGLVVWLVAYRKTEDGCAVVFS